jgi:hypothetical protein
MTFPPPPRRVAPSPDTGTRARRGGAGRAVVIGVVAGLVVLAGGAVVLALLDDDDSPARDAAQATEASAPETWRLGFEGFGPIELGMTLDEASRAAGFTITESTDCPGAAHAPQVGDLLVTVTSGGRIAHLSTNAPSLSTISGAHVGTTEDELLAIYPAARTETGHHSAPVYRITNASGARVDFYMQGANDTVSAIVVAANEDDYRVLNACD